ncbi:HNH endonuclease [Arthrobacter rhombi]|uniref:HNH endonuclease n=1 Tax=Arthrobacter rhombi TaxID=71253 RepID=UPI003FD4C703
MKACTRCGEDKPLEDFHKRKRARDGHTSYCKACKRLEAETYRDARREHDKAHRAANREQLNAQRRASYAASPNAARKRDKAYREANAEQIAVRKRAHYAENRDRAIKASREWVEANPERVAAYRRDYYDANRGRILEEARAYQHAHPEVGWAATYRQRSKAYGFEPVVEDFTRAELIALYGDACAHCGGAFEQLDHHPVPVVLGGAHTLGNVRPCCTACNLSPSNDIKIAKSSR